eukprot:CAMPEP_0174931308 /NCGR_PEP_ID=MMETSP1355-20121228/33113_1 /TAXON_ID=464990 /ORGANISM="Hemiselmis tepida, Strain CCMP443" /LENGTH=215 /DNA_ID=CAMNT_0016177653 /DNA_START=42 /DNA_END=689 /DNA_ORIENTATION=+
MASMRVWLLLGCAALAAPAMGFQVLPGGAPVLRAPRATSGVTRLSMRFSTDRRVFFKLPGGEDAILTANVVEVQETEVVETKVSKGAGLTMDKAAMGQAPFWVSVIGGMTVLKMVRQKLAGRSVLDNKDAQFIPQNEEEEKELKIFSCADCGYELMPARGREGKFFAKDFKCPICGADKDKFWDANDPTDPRNQEEEAPAAEASTPPPKEDGAKE